MKEEENKDDDMASAIISIGVGLALICYVVYVLL